jgi:hypothetical protein
MQTFGGLCSPYVGAFGAHHTYGLKSLESLPSSVNVGTFLSLYVAGSDRLNDTGCGFSPFVVGCRPHTRGWDPLDRQGGN